MFLYFVPQTFVTETLKKPTLTQITRDDLTAIGLEYLDRVEARQVSAGPGGEPGWLIYRSIHAMPAYEPPKQQWRQRTGKAGLYIGRINGFTPGPSDLARSDMLPGHAVQLGDDRHWIIPAARQHDDDGLWSCSLPSSIALDDEENWTQMEVLDKYAKLWDFASRYWEAAITATAQGQNKFVFADLMKLCVEAISTNYCVGPIEISMLKLITTANQPLITRALLDMATFEQVLQKKSAANDIGSSLSGPDASTQAP